MVHRRLLTASARPKDVAVGADSSTRVWCAAKKHDPPVRIDYIFSDGQPQTAALVNRKTAAGTPFSDHFGIEVR